MPDPTLEQLGAPLSGAEAPKAPEALGALHEDVEKTTLQTAIEKSIEGSSQRFKNLIKEHDDFDFAGEHDSAEELEQNSAFDIIFKGLKAFFEDEVKKTPDAPLLYFSEWMNKSSDFLTSEIEDYDDSSGAMGIVEAEATLEALKDANKTGPRMGNPGIGPFEEWFKATYPTEYQTWKDKKESTKQDAEFLSNKKTELEGRVTALEEEFSKMTETDEIKKNKEDLTDLKTKIPNAKDEATVAAYETTLIALEGSAVEYKKQTAEKVKQEAEQKADAEKQKLEQEAKAAEEKKVEEEAALSAEEEQDAPIADKLLNFAKRLPEDSKLKPILTMIAGFLVSIGVGMAKIPWVGGKIRGTLISNKLLAEKGDELAVKAIKTERLFRKYGFPRIFANELGEIPTAEAIKVLNQKAAGIKPEEITDEAAKKTAIEDKIKFTNLAQALTQQGGDKNQQSLFDFVASKEWETPAPLSGAATPTAPVAPAPLSGAPSAAPSTAPAPLSGTPAVAAAAPAVAPVETPETKLIRATNEVLKPYNNRTIDLTKETLSFRLPYISQNGGIEYADCSIKENNFTIGGHKYKLELPAGANLKTIKIEGPVQTGSTELVAGRFGFSDSKEIPLKTLLANLDSLRKEPKDRTIAIGGDSATFKYMA